MKLSSRLSRLESLARETQAGIEDSSLAAILEDNPAFARRFKRMDRMIARQALKMGIEIPPLADRRGREDVIIKVLTSSRELADRALPVLEEAIELMKAEWGIEEGPGK